MSADRLPDNVSLQHRALANATYLMPDLVPGVEYISGWKYSRQPPDLRPFLVDEYGLAALVPYLSSYAEVLARGLPWARVRGTHSAVAQGLDMVGYSGTIQDPPARRLAWAEFQIDLDRVRDERDDLPKIAGIVDLSIPERSTFRRGVHGYDVPAAEGCRTRLSGSILGDDSGVRIDGKGPKWSFGRAYRYTHVLTEGNLTALGVWLPEVPSQLWADMQFPWATATFKWADDAALGRRVSMASAIEALPCWLRFADDADQTIGYRRAVCRGVEQGLTGYAFGTDYLEPNLENPIGVHVFARTGFGDGYGAEAASVSIVFGADVTDQSKPGQLWLEPAGLTGGVEIASQPISILFGETVREYVQFFLRF
ncbi:hypothetical protein FIU93_28145 [Labrenzia sp. THAF35]|uniref:phage tail protein n=1 Tax=Labrenzia sp. THAF35 TaxID=2587854 RepID=UPI001267C506|nr:phage tail protein [Labrenzia sp. THAF35]QFT70688.1 hypothetical protein FIU93_28145 [Labrenzia sp. THAF35]